MTNAECFVADWPRLDPIHGWLSREAAATMDIMLAAQDALEAPGQGLLEIGVWKGRSAALQARHLRPGEDMLLVDAALQQQEIKTSLSLALGGEFDNHRLTLFQGTAAGLSTVVPAGKRYRHVHIDAEHSAAALRADLTAARRLLEPTGLIVLDDIFNDLYPQLARELFAFLAGEGRDFACVLLGFNKAWLCQTRVMDAYGDFIFAHLNEEMAARDVPVTLCRTTDRVEWPGFSVVADTGVPKRGPDFRMDYLRP